MSFYDEVRAAMKSKEQVANEQESLEREKELLSLNNTAKYIYDAIKRDILSKSSQGDFSNDKISGIVPIYYFTGGYNDDVLPEGYFISAKYHSTYDRHGGIFRFHDVHKLTIEFNDVPKILKAYSILVNMCKTDGISISEPFIHAIVYEYMNMRKMIRDYCIPTKNNRLKYTLRYDSYISKGHTTGEEGKIDLAIKYEFNI